jgi:hypothetical protein
MKHELRLFEKHALFPPDNVKHSGNLGLDVRIILKVCISDR